MQIGSLAAQLSTAEVQSQLHADDQGADFHKGTVAMRRTESARSGTAFSIVG